MILIIRRTSKNKTPKKIKIEENEKGEREENKYKKDF